MTGGKREDITHTKTGGTELDYIAAKTEQPWTLRMVCPIAVGRGPFGAKLKSKAAAFYLANCVRAEILHDSRPNTHTEQ